MNDIRKPPSQEMKQPFRKMHEIRRQQTLNRLLFGSIMITGVILISMLIVNFVHPDAVSDSNLARLIQAGIILMAVLFVIAFLNRHGSSLAARIIFNIVIFLGIFLGDTPEQILHGRSLLYFILPVIAAGVLFHPRAGYIAAAICGLTISILSVTLNLDLPDIPAVFFLFLVAFVVEQSTSSLERSVEGLNLAKQTLQEQEERFRVLIESSTDLIAIIGVDNRIAYVSPSIEQWLGYRPDEVTGRAILEYVHPEDRAISEAALRVGVPEEVIGPMLVLRLEHKNGNWIVFEVVGNSMYNHPAILGTVVTCRSISERQRVEMALRDSEEKFSKAFHQNPMSMAITSQDGTFVEINRAFTQLLKYPAKEAIGKTPGELGMIVNPEQVGKAYQILQERGRLRDHEMELRSRSGKIVQVIFYAEPLQLADQPLFLTALEDVTERNRAEIALRDSEEKFSKAFHHNPMPMAISDHEYKCIEINQAFTQLFSYTAEEAIGKTIVDLGMVVIPEQLERAFQIFSEQGRLHDYEMEVRTGSGKILQGVVHTEALMIADQPNFLSIMEDITDRKQAEDELRKNNQLLESTLTSLDDAVLAIDSNTSKIIECNPATASMFGYKREEILGKGKDFLHINKENFNIFKQELTRQVNENGRMSHFEFEMRHKDGSIFPSEHSVTPLEDAEGKQMGWVSVIHDITRRKQSENQLRESEERYRRLIEILPIGVGVHQSGKIQLINPTGAKMLGGENPDRFIGIPFLELAHPDDREMIVERIRNSQKGGTLAEPTEERFVRVDGSSFDVEVVAVPIQISGQTSMLVMFQDITQRKQTQEAIVLQSQRIQEVSQQLVNAQEHEKHMLAGELHDDLGQSLTSLKLMLEMAERAHSTPQRKTVMEDAHGLVSELMGKVRNLSLDLRPAMLDDFGLFAALRWLFDRFHSQTGISVLCKSNLDSDQRFPPAVETGAFRIIQEALTNIARHAGVKQAEVKIETGNAISIEIRDSGTGFDPIQGAQVGKTTGGISGMQERARLLGGQVIINSKKGTGTRILAELPLVGGVT
jgi:PAS domain S-box-containing protein